MSLSVLHLHQCIPLSKRMIIVIVCPLSLLQLSFCYFNCTLLPHFHVNIKSNQPQSLFFFHIYTGYVSHVQQTMKLCNNQALVNIDDTLNARIRTFKKGVFCVCIPLTDIQCMSGGYYANYGTLAHPSLLFLFSSMLSLLPLTFVPHLCLFFLPYFFPSSNPFQHSHCACMCVCVCICVGGRACTCLVSSRCCSASSRVISCRIE